LAFARLLAKHILIACAGAIAALPSAAFARTTATVASQVAIVPHLSLVNTHGLDFGGIIAGKTAGTVTVGQDGTVSRTGGATPVSGAATARFYGYGAYNQIVSLRLSRNSYTITRSGGTQTMTVDNFTVSSTPPTTLTTTATNFRISEADGFFGFDVGATLHVSANQKSGYYVGSFSLTIQYF
jgi:hypothetical protein